MLTQVPPAWTKGTMKLYCLIGVAALVSAPASAAGDRLEPLDMSQVTLQERADAASVALYFAGKTAPANTTAIAEIEGVSCQKAFSGKQPSEDEALNQLRIRAARIHANAVLAVTLRTALGNPVFGEEGHRCSIYVSAVGVAVKAP